MKINKGDELIDKFATKLVEDKGEVLDEAEKKLEKEKIVSKVNDLFIDEIMGRLPEDRLEALDKIIETSEKEGNEVSEDKINAIIFGAKLNYREIIEKVILGYRKEYLGEEA